MQYTYLGPSGLRVSRLALGTMNFGPFTEEKDAFLIMDAALDHGINLFDTANMYGMMSPEGHAGWTEEIVGRWLAQGGGRRERVVLATKLYWPMNDASYGPNDAPGLSAYKIRRNLEDSLRRLQTDHIDLYQMHRPDRRTPWAELWEAFELAAMRGEITYVGASNFNAYDLAKAQWAADKRNKLGLVCTQSRYNLLYRKCEGDFLPALRELGLGLICWGPMAEGFLAGKYAQSSGTRKGLIDPIDEKNLARLKQYGALCRQLGHTEAEIALAWLLHQPAVTCPLIGPRTMDHLLRALPAQDIRLDAEALAALDGLFPKGEAYTEGPMSWREIT